MKQPNETPRNTNRIFQQEFRGVNLKLRPLESELTEAINLTSREYPALTTRGERDYITDIGRCTSPSLCALGDDEFAYLSRDRNGHHINIRGNIVHTFSNDLPTPPHSMVKMGAYLCVFPEGVVYNTADGSVKNIKVSISNNEDEITMLPSKLDGKIAVVSEEMPNESSVGNVWYNPKEGKTFLCTLVSDIWEKEDCVVFDKQIDLTFASDAPRYAAKVSGFSGGCALGETGEIYVFNGGNYIGTEHYAPIVSKLVETAEDGEFALLNDAIGCSVQLYQYRANRSQWTAYPTSYVRVETKNTDISKLFSVGDVIEISGVGYVRVYTSVSANEASNGYIVVEHFDIPESYSKDGSLTISRNLPFGITNIFECANRLWGTSPDGREIYASKLGDPFNWYAFSGLSSDSYAVTVGSGGIFTGGISYEGYPHFFKEDSIIKVYGNYPFRLFAVNCPGVAKESSKSISVLGSVIIYKGYDGFYAYDGNYPKCISEVISNISHSEYRVSASASDNSAYYAAVKHKSGCAIYVYEKGFWHIQDAPARSPSLEEYEIPSGTVIDLCNIGRHIVAAFVAQDAETEMNETGTGYLPPTIYLVSISGGSYNVSGGQIELYKAIHLKYCEYNNRHCFMKENRRDFKELKIGDMFSLDDNIYAVKHIIEVDDHTTVIDVGEINDSSLVEGKEYQIYKYRNAPLTWRFSTAEYGLSSPDDKYYSHFIFRYAADEPVEVTVVYDDGYTETASLPAKNTLGSKAISIVPRRSDFIHLKLAGKGKFTLLSICGNIEGGKNP